MSSMWGYRHRRGTNRIRRLQNCILLCLWEYVQASFTVRICSFHEREVRNREEFKGQHTTSCPRTMQVQWVSHRSTNRCDILVQTIMRCAKIGWDALKLSLCVWISDRYGKRSKEFVILYNPCDGGFCEQGIELLLLNHLDLPCNVYTLLLWKRKMK